MSSSNCCFLTCIQVSQEVGKVVWYFHLFQNFPQFVVIHVTVVLEKTLESPLDRKEIQPVYSEGDQPWDFFGGNDAKAETPVLWPLYVKS